MQSHNHVPTSDLEFLNLIIAEINTAIKTALQYYSFMRQKLVFNYEQKRLILGLINAIYNYAGKREPINPIFQIDYECHSANDKISMDNIIYAYTPFQSYISENSTSNVLPYNNVAFPLLTDCKVNTQQAFDDLVKELRSKLYTFPNARLFYGRFDRNQSNLNSPIKFYYSKFLDIFTDKSKKLASIGMLESLLLRTRELLLNKAAVNEVKKSLTVTYATSEYQPIVPPDCEFPVCKDIVLEIAKYLGPKSLSRLRCTSKDFNTFLSDAAFWFYLVSRDFRLECTVEYKDIIEKFYVNYDYFGLYKRFAAPTKASLYAAVYVSEDSYDMLGGDVVRLLNRLFINNAIFTFPWIDDTQQKAIYRLIGNNRKEQNAHRIFVLGFSAMKNHFDKVNQCTTFYCDASNLVEVLSTPLNFMDLQQRYNDRAHDNDNEYSLMLERTYVRHNGTSIVALSEDERCTLTHKLNR